MEAVVGGGGRGWQIVEMVFPFEGPAQRSVRGQENYPIFEVSASLDLIGEPRDAGKTSGGDIVVEGDVLSQTGGTDNIDLDIFCDMSAAHIL